MVCTCTEECLDAIFSIEGAEDLIREDLVDRITSKMQALKGLCTVRL